MADGNPAVAHKEKAYLLDIFAVIVFTGMSTFGILALSDGNPVRVALGIPLIVFLPGYAMVCAVWPKKDDKMSLSERIMFGVGLSLVIIPIVGLILNYVLSITLVPIAISLSSITISCALIALYRRSTLPAKDRFSLSFSLRGSAAVPSMSSAQKVLLAIIIAAIVIVSGTIIYLILNPVDSGPYTEFYLVDRDRMLENLPKSLRVNETAIVYVGFYNHENRDIAYTLHASVENSTQDISFISSSSIEMSENDRWATEVFVEDSAHFEQMYTLRFQTPGRYKVLWQLAFDGQSTVYTVHLWIDAI